MTLYRRRGKRRINPNAVKLCLTDEPSHKTYGLDDVDVVVEFASYISHTEMDEKLRKLEFVNDMEYETRLMTGVKNFSNVVILL